MRFWLSNFLDKIAHKLFWRAFNDAIQKADAPELERWEYITNKTIYFVPELVEESERAELARLKEKYEGV